MNLVADESVDQQIVDLLRAEGHAVVYIAEMVPGIPDVEVLRLANSGNAVLLTNDKDFGELVYRQRLISSGVILIRLTGFSPEQKATVVCLAITKHTLELPGAFTVISRGMVRIRRQ